MHGRAGQHRRRRAACPAQAGGLNRLMFLTIDRVLSKDSLAALCAALAEAPFISGKATAGWRAKAVKTNAQLSPDAPPSLKARIAAAGKALETHPVFQAAVRPKALSPLIASRYRPEDFYGPHIDNAVMSGLRTDIAFTLFLSEPDDYAGGELSIDTPGGKMEIKAPAGCAFVYPATSVHRVRPVEAGERLALVGWAQSLVRDPMKREILFDLETALCDAHASDLSRETVNLIEKSLSNCLRLWAEP